MFVIINVVSNYKVIGKNFKVSHLLHCWNQKHNSYLSHLLENSDHLFAKYFLKKGKKRVPCLDQRTKN